MIRRPHLVYRSEPDLKSGQSIVVGCGKTITDLRCDLMTDADLRGGMDWSPYCENCRVALEGKQGRYLYSVYPAHWEKKHAEV